MHMPWGHRICRDLTYFPCSSPARFLIAPADHMNNVFDRPYWPRARNGLGFWSHFRVLMITSHYFELQTIFLGALEDNNKRNGLVTFLGFPAFSLPVLSLFLDSGWWSSLFHFKWYLLEVQRKYELYPDCCPLRVNSNFPTSIHNLCIWESFSGTP